MSLRFDRRRHFLPTSRSGSNFVYLVLLRILMLRIIYDMYPYIMNRLMWFTKSFHIAY